MKSLRPYWLQALLAAALATLGYLGFVMARPPEGVIRLTAFFVSVAGLLGGSVLFLGATIRATLPRLGCGDQATARTFKHSVGVGLSASCICLLEIAAFTLALRNFNAEGPSEFTHSEGNWVLEVFGKAVFVGYFWPSHQLEALVSLERHAGLMWLFASLFWGFLVYALILVSRAALTRIRRSHAGAAEHELRIESRAGVFADGHHREQS